MRIAKLLIFFFISVTSANTFAQVSTMAAPPPGGGGGTPPPAPPTPTVSTNTCGDKIVTRSGTPPSGQEWYWQTTSTGTSLTSSAATYTVSQAGTRYIYLRAYQISSALWSDPAFVSVTVNPYPATPATPILGASCSSPTLSRGTPPSSPAGTTWYWQGTDANGMSTANANSTYAVSASGTYYLRARSGAGCWSTSSAGTAVTVHNPAVTPPPVRVEPGVVEMTATASSSYTIKWYDAVSGGNLLHTGHTFSKYTEGNTTYYATASTSQVCEGPRTPVSVTIEPKPVITYSYPFLVKGRAVELSVSNNTYSVYNWYRYDGTTSVLVGTTPTITVTDQPGTYYVVVSKSTMTGSGTSESVVLQYAQNYVRVNGIAKEGVTSESSIPTLPIGERAQVTSFSGGLGNALQTISSKSSPASKDMIAFQVYNADGVQVNQYLPYTSTADNSEFRPSAVTEQAQFYTNTPKVATDSKPYSTIELEKSPLGRVLSATGVGDAWHTNNKKTTSAFLLNRATEGIRIWKLTTAGLPTSTATYPDYQLFVNQITDENGNRTKTYTDKTGRLILKMVEETSTSWLRTYYVYTDKGQLAYVISPEGVSKNVYSPTQAWLDQWTFQYRYDAFGRLIEYKAPAGGWQYYVYDALHRVVMTQNAIQRTQSRWMFVKYDSKGRPVLTGSKVITSSTRTSVQNSVNTQANLFEIPAVSSIGYTLNRTYPTAVEGDLLSISYFDNYNFLSYTGWDAEANSFAFVAEMGSSAYETAVAGLPTGGKIKVLESTKWLNAVQYYDKYYRPLQMIAENHLGGTDRNTNKFNNLRQLAENRLSHNNAAVIVIRKMQYDHAGRAVKVFQNINSAPADQLVAQYEYNALGQLVDKKLHNTTGTTFLQSVDFRYTIRGWLSSINNAALNVNSLNNDEATDYFGMEFLYNTVDSGIGNTATHNGNISAAKWKGPGSAAGLTDQNVYKYTYDKSERLTTAVSMKNSGTGWTQQLNALNESATYDLNGNIKTLQRNHAKHQLSGTTVSYVSEAMDNLTYAYSTTQGNQLLKVTDAVPLAIGRNDFKDNANLATEYTYNTNGDLTMDKNKGIDSVHYNMLGKVRRVKFTNGTVVVYFYDASGNKIKMKTTTGGTTTTTDYLGGFVYEQGSLSFFASPEGRVVKNGTAFEYQYAIGDNQGNTRVVFSSVTPAPLAPVATFEGTSGDNTGEYLNVTAGNIVTNVAANHTSGGSKVIKMNQSYKIGPSKSIKVFPGDKIDMEVWEYHEGSSGFGTTSTPLTTLVSMVSGVFGGVSGAPGDPGLIYSGVNGAINAFVPGGNLGSTRPAAYLNYILFDRNYDVLDMGWTAAPATTFTKQKLSFPTKNITEAGYLFVYLSYDNDSNNWVYFDDLKVTHTKTNVIQYNEYYPFGLQTANSWTREDATDNKYLYNGGAELNSTTGWYETFFRGYDATLGRFLQVDPLAQQASSFTPYNYAFNNPVMLNDPMGDYPQEVKNDMEQHREYLANGGGQNYFTVGGGYQGPGSGHHWADKVGGYQAIRKDSQGNLVIEPNAMRHYGGSWSRNSRYEDFMSFEDAILAGIRHIERFGGSRQGSPNHESASDRSPHRYRWKKRKGSNTDYKYLGRGDDNFFPTTFQVLHSALDSFEMDWFLETIHHRTTQVTSTVYTQNFVVILYVNEPSAENHGEVIEIIKGSRRFNANGGPDIQRHNVRDVPFKMTPLMQDWVFSAIDYHCGYCKSEKSVIEKYVDFILTKPDHYEDKWWHLVPRKKKSWPGNGVNR